MNFNLNTEPFEKLPLEYQRDLYRMYRKQSGVPYFNNWVEDTMKEHRVPRTPAGYLAAAKAILDAVDRYETEKYEYGDECGSEYD